ncbi:YDG/SRA domain-containing protein [Streptomyces sp. H10-C2]|uniref:YDG/SRA domain-containing protein n=1 Tax=unclassified Streptomyces TaxID=2593676 RepID=UPI0024B95132|nr:MULTISPECIES: YDG/SRA domain-containing protein [unclassified Streptomyces]MDJ0344955.1 YDG/SRA domain-containing protein [Streptomyces sp. PH10-H1]MDJ0373964.1 YDG/SRA domain-containing protein [Streptomyces sp. H10-C2]
MANKSAVSFGDIPGVAEGMVFSGHSEMNKLGVHRQSGRGISGTEAEGVDSIVLSGGYVDDRDDGDVILYTGRDKQDDRKRLVEDMPLAGSPNAGFLVNMAKGYPIRVIEGFEVKGGSKKYRYRGLYRAVDGWDSIGIDGWRIWQFKLVKGARPAPVPADEAKLGQGAGDETPVERALRRIVEQSRLVRDAKNTAEVKRLHDNLCQICRIEVRVSLAGGRYSEGAHIQALGEPHNGPDKVSNMLCLCPNCHIRFDRGAIVLTDDLQIIDRLNGNVHKGELWQADGHDILPQFVRAHRSRWELEDFIV